MDRTNLNEPDNSQGAPESNSPNANGPNANPTTPMVHQNRPETNHHENGPNAHERTRRHPERTGMGRTHDDEPYGSRELNPRGQWKSTRPVQGRRVMVPDDCEVGREWTWTERIRRVYGNGPIAPERTKGRTRMNGTHRNDEAQPKSPNENGPTEREQRTGMDRTHPNRRTVVDRTHDDEPNDTHGSREWTDHT